MSVYLIFVDANGVSWTLRCTKLDVAVNLPLDTTDFRGDRAVIVGGIPPRHEGSTGRVITAAGNEYYPSVFDLYFQRLA